MLYNRRASMMRKNNSVREIFPKNKKLTISCFYCQMPGFGNYAIIHHFTPVFSNHRIELETYFLMNLFNNQTRVHTTLFTPVRPSITDHTQNFPVASLIRPNRFSLDNMRTLYDLGVFRNPPTNRSDFIVNRCPKVYLEPLKSHILWQIN